MMLRIIRMINAFFIRISSQHIGTDDAGNEYYARTERAFIGGMRQRRFIVYNSEQEASKIDAEWHGWLHHATNIVPGSKNDKSVDKSWEKTHQENVTGTVNAYLPDNHVLAHADASKKSANKPYEAWSPNDTQ